MKKEDKSHRDFKTGGHKDFKKKPVGYKTGDLPIANFMCLTQTNGMASFGGVRGVNYTSYKGQYFKVHGKEDIEFFNKNKRFQKKGLVKTKEEKNKEAQQKEASRLAAMSFEERLLEKKFSAKTSKVVGDAYVDEAHLKDELMRGGKLPEEISESDKKKIKKIYMKGDE